MPGRFGNLPHVRVNPTRPRQDLNLPGSTDAVVIKWFSAAVERHFMVNQYKHLEPKRGSNYRQLFVNGRIRAEVLYRETVGQEKLTAEDVAREYQVPVEAVMEAVEYCLKNQDVLDADRAMEEATIKTHGLDKWPHAPRDYRPNQ
jgi:hypothetical protein